MNEMQKLSDAEFAALGDLMTFFWEEKDEDPDVWLDFKARMNLRNIAIRHALDDTGVSNLILEEHANRSDAFWATRKNDGSVKPVRVVHFRRIDNEWSGIE